MKYIMDANIYINSYRLSYPFDLFPSYWNEIVMFSKNKHIYINQQVFAEIAHETTQSKKDQLQLWLEDDFDGVSIDINQNIINVWQEILKYIRDSHFYNQRAFDSWADSSVADPWLIASAKVKNLTVVTMELDERNLHQGSPTKRVKIPDICKAFNVPCVTLQDMLRDLQFSL